MSQTLYYDPFRFFESQRRVRDSARTQGSEWSPQVDIVESSEKYQLMLDMPGIDPQQIDITQEKNVLTVSALRKPPQLGEGEMLTRRERKSGNLKRQFTLPEDADVESIQATSSLGVLTLSIARKIPASATRKIEIQQ